MRILGLDPGMQRLGIALVQFDPDAMTVEPKFFGTMGRAQREDEKYNEYVDSQIHDIADHFPRVLHLYEPDIVVAEYIPPGMQGSKSETNVAAATVCKVICWQFGISWIGLAANTVKKEAAGHGRATKAQVRNAIIKLIPKAGEVHKHVKAQQKEVGEKAEGVDQDAFDAMAIAIAYVNKFYGKTNPI